MRQTFYCCIKCGRNAHLPKLKSSPCKRRPSGSLCRWPRRAGSDSRVRPVRGQSPPTGPRRTG
eukprot:8095850-Pyramimonas_sp.AAC.1